MNKKKQLTVLLICLIILIFLTNLLLKNNNHTYKLESNKQEFIINESYKNKNYYIEIKDSKNVYPIRIFEKLKRNKKVVTNIHYYKDNNYECILPVIDNKLIVDMMCYKDNILYDYNKISGIDSDLDEFIKTIDIYDKDKFKNDISGYKSINTVKLYRNNEISNKVAITTYKGLIISGMEIELFKKDIYNNKLSTFVDNYYVIADYDNNYDFDYFYIVNLLTGDIDKLKVKDKISLDSYIQGIVDNKVYLYDKDNENQYEIDVNKKEVNIISSRDNIKYYKNNKWETINKVKANKEIYFDYTSLNNDFSEYDYVLESIDYYYLFKENNNKYDLYKVDKNNLEVYKFIETIPTKTIYFKDNYIYYEFDNKIYFYSDTTGTKTLLEDSELSFNDTIKYYIY